MGHHARYLECEPTFMAALRYAFLRSVSFTSMGTLSCHCYKSETLSSRRAREVANQVVILCLYWRHGQRDDGVGV